LEQLSAIRGVINRALGQGGVLQNLLSSLEPRDVATGLVHVVVDTPRGARNKLKYDEELGCFRLSRVLPLGHVFPYDFGSVPRTRAADGDALDVLVLLDAATVPGCLVTVRLIGGLVALQTEGPKTIRNDRLLGAPQTPANPPRFRRLEDLGGTRLDEIEQFFVAYNRAHGRIFEPTGRLGPDDAEKCLDAAIAEYRTGKGT
jgi:inorganic pyrophosphatase